MFILSHDYKKYQYSVFLIVIISLVTGYLAFTWKWAPLGVNMMDLFTFRDGAYRMTFGQLPSVDYFSPLGPLTYFLFFIAEKLGAGVDYYAVCFFYWIMIIPILLVVLQQFHRTWSCGLFILFTAAITILPFNIDSQALCYISYNVPYNRLATVIGLLVSILVFTGYFKRERKSDWLLLLYIMIFSASLKITILAQMGLIFLLLLIYFPQSRVSILRASCLFVLILFAVDLSTGMVTAQINDLIITSRVSAGSALSLIFRIWIKNFYVILLLFGFLFFEVVKFKSILGNYLRNIRLSVKGVSIGFIGFFLVVTRRTAIYLGISAAVLFLYSQNFGGIGPLELVALSVPLWRKVVRRVDTKFDDRMRTLSVVGLCSLLFYYAEPIIQKDILYSLCIAKNSLLDKDYYYFQPEIKKYFPEFKFHSRLLPLIGHDPKWDQTFDVIGDFRLHQIAAIYLGYFRQLSKATDILLAETTPHQQNAIVTLDFANPFPKLLKAKPLIGSYVTMHFERTLNKRIYISPQKLLAKAQLVLVPRCNIFRHNSKLVDIYKPYLNVYFKSKYLTKCWSLYIRNN